MTEPNFRVLKKSRKAPKAGDVFVIQMPDERFLFGRVIDTEAMAGPSMPGAILIYIYRDRFDSKVEPDHSALSIDGLLVPPIMTNRLAWAKGYFETVAHWPLEPAEVLPQHCFLSASRGRYFDEAGNEMSGPVEPVGDYGLHSFRTIDDAVSDALGIGRVP